MKTFRIIGFFLMSVMLNWACTEKEEEAEISCSIEEMNFMQDAEERVMSFTVNKLWSIRSTLW